MELLLEGSEKAVKEAAAQGTLTWKGKKVVLDPFLAVGFIFEIESKGQGRFCLTPYLLVGSFQERIETCDLLCTLGALQRGTFRFWKNRDPFKPQPAEVSAKQLETLIQEGVAHRFKGDVPRLKPPPLPILKLTDRTAGFASLYLDYGAWGEVGFHENYPSSEEQHWENDLLETGFRKKKVGSSHYFCPLDQVGKSIAFLLEMGWKVLDHRGKKVVQQSKIHCYAEETLDAFVLRGSVSFDQTTLAIQDVVAVVEQRERWIDLSSSEVGLIELPPAWEDITFEAKTAEGIRACKSQISVIQEIASLPPAYQKAEWQEVMPGAGFQGVLFPYQQKALAWMSFLYRAGFSGLLADEMGLGKTVQVLAFLTKREGKVLIVMPVSLLSLWREQLRRFYPDASVYVHQGKARHETGDEGSIILTSYATLRADIELFEKVMFDTVILDEAQAIKNSSTQIAQSVYRLRSKFRLALTGTPIENRIEELHSIFHFLMPGLLETPLLTQKSRKKLRPFVLRRTKQEVGLDLPEKILQVVGVDPSEDEQALYADLLRSKKTELMRKIEQEGLPAHRMEVLELILRLRQLACHPCLLDPSYTGQSRKFSQVLADLEEGVASKSKVLVYSQFTSVLKLFEKELQRRGWRYAYLDGSTRDRETPVQQFQNDPGTLLFLISLKAGGVGLNLQAADYVFLYDPWWNTAAEHQAIDRAHRVGRQNTVIARKYFTSNTIEAKLLELQAKKEALATELWQAQDISWAAQLSFETVAALLNF